MNNISSILRDGRSLKWLRFQSLEETVETHDLSEVLDKLHMVCDLVEKNGWYAAGFVSYEASPAFDPALVTQKKPRPPWYGSGFFLTWIIWIIFHPKKNPSRV